MRTTTILALLAGLLLGASQSHAAIIIPGADGSDGALNITADTVIDLSQAVTGAWDTNNTANAGKGIYDALKWAVVFKYSSVLVAPGTTVTFKNHASRAPVVWLVSGNVTISGTVNLDGQSWQSAPLLSEPGPGGFRGGTGLYSVGVGASPGMGVGGGIRNVGDYGNAGGGGSYGSQGQSGSATYGNPSLVPLLGGSGGAGTNLYQSSGGGGAGAFLIACANTISVEGNVRANGGEGDAAGYYPSGSGSGGGIRLVAEILTGAGSLSALAGTTGIAGGLGRIRVERVVNDNTITVAPDPSVVSLNSGDTALLWPPSGAPQVKIISIGGQNIAADPRAEFGTIGADAVLPQTSSTDVLIETTNVEQASQLKVRATPRSNGDHVEVDAAFSSVVSTTPLILRWTATLPVNVGYSAVQVKVIRP